MRAGSVFLSARFFVSWYNFFMFDAEDICKRIFKAVYIARMMRESLEPVAYIHIRAGKTVFAGADEICEGFAKLKWDSPLSTADLEISFDGALPDNALEIDSVENFFDDEKWDGLMSTCGVAEKYPVQEDDRLIVF